jgi:Methyltransferase domain/C-methyltransferase C-terminal domain
MIRFPTHPSSTPCPSCSKITLHPFYTVTNIPTQSNLLMSTRDEALNYPKGDLQLASCSSCGFITNTAFDPSTQEHSTRYEATQAHSPTFTAFAKSLAQRWIDRYKLHGKTILEIGCLNGEFVSTLCILADTKGIGIDPVLDPSRTPDTAGRVQFIKDFYSEKYAHLSADFICCRHTLEHIAQPHDFLTTIRKTIGTRTDVMVCFEVPDVQRVLQEGAFWDLYYEHCSYFTPASLADLFTRTGFEVIDQRREFDDQYLILDAQPKAHRSAVAPTDPTPVIPFESPCSAQLKKWHAIIDSAPKIALWGSGSKAVGFLSTLDISDEQIPFVVDINPHKQNTYLPGTAQKIIPPQQLVDYQPELIIAMNPVYRNEIQQDLNQMNLRADLLTL